MSLRARLLPTSAALAVVANTLYADEANAHVKWFCAFDVAGQPRNLENVLCTDFELLVGVAMLVLLMGCLLERTPRRRGHASRLRPGVRRPAGQYRADVPRRLRLLLYRHLGRRRHPAHPRTQDHVDGHRIATSRHRGGNAVAADHAVVGARYRDPFCDRRSMQYGAFHLADYPVFLGVAAYLALVGMQRDLFGMRPLDVVRWAAAITLMWASVEKWAYPQWTLPADPTTIRR